MEPASGGAAALAAQLQRQAMDIAAHEIESLDLAAEVSVADMVAITAWGARMYLLGLGDRAAVARKAAPAAPAKSAAPAAVQRRVRRSDRRDVAAACAASGHRTPGNDGQCACGTFALDSAGGGR